MNLGSASGRSYRRQDDRAVIQVNSEQALHASMKSDARQRGLVLLR